MYQFFNKWCPSIHNATDDDEGESDEDAETSKESIGMMEEVTPLLKYVTGMVLKMKILACCCYVNWNSVYKPFGAFKF